MSVEGKPVESIYLIRVNLLIERIILLQKNPIIFQCTGEEPVESIYLIG